MREFRSRYNSPSKRILNALKAIKLKFGKVEVERVAIIKFRMYKCGSNGASSGVIEAGANSAKVTNEKKATLR